MEFKDVVRRRRMVRNYTTGPREEEKLRGGLDIARHAPSAGVTQGQSFVVVRDAATGGKIAEIAGEGS